LHLTMVPVRQDLGLWPAAAKPTALEATGSVDPPAAPGRKDHEQAHSSGRLFYPLVAEPGSLIMERKMLLGIKERAERLAGPGAGSK
jgi:hypothetical protein